MAIDIYKKLIFNMESLERLGPYRTGKFSLVWGRRRFQNFDNGLARPQSEGPFRVLREEV